MMKGILLRGGCSSRACLSGMAKEQPRIGSSQISMLSTAACMPQSFFGSVRNKMQHQSRRCPAWQDVCHALI